METPQLSGFLFINKPKDITSFECIRKLQKIVGYKKGIGHTGTLDPFATGLLIIAFGRSATKHSDKFLRLDKTYVAKGKLGQLTDTLDYTGTVIVQADASAIHQFDIESAIQQLGIQYTQTPPIYAALKHQGKPLYQLARNEELTAQELAQIAEQKQRTVNLYKLELIDWQPPFFTLKAHVSHGTYIRSLVNDIAQRAGSCATTYELERTNIGPFSLDNAITLNEITTLDDIKKHLISIKNMLDYLC